MNQKRIFWMIVLFLVASLDVLLVRRLEQSHGLSFKESQLVKEEEALFTLRALELPPEAYERLNGQKTDGSGELIESRNAEKMLAYLFCQSQDEADLERWCKIEQAAAPQAYDTYTAAIQRIFSDAVYFPVPQAADEKVSVAYENSWQSQRTYGGVRGHEGCDLMASVQQRGYYPVVSVSDGVVEKIGWLPQGGYRIGIRSRHQVYYYYAHLAEYEDGIAQGTEVTAGQLIGYMGDTGYSEIEGTTGNFPVHLHFGIYLDLDGQGEASFNPYCLLAVLEAHKLKYVYQK